MILQTSSNVVCQPHFRKARSGSEFDRDICEMMLFGEIKRGEVLSVVRGECKFFSCIESIGIAESEMTYMRPVSAR